MLPSELVKIHKPTYTCGHFDSQHSRSSLISDLTINQMHETVALHLSKITDFQPLQIPLTSKVLRSVYPQLKPGSGCSLCVRIIISLNLKQTKIIATRIKPNQNEIQLGQNSNYVTRAATQGLGIYQQIQP